MPGILYNCDPEKNIMCSKAECYKHGGCCSKTRHPEYKKTDGKAIIVLSVDKADAEVIYGDDEVVLKYKMECIWEQHCETTARYYTTTCGKRLSKIFAETTALKGSVKRKCPFCGKTIKEAEHGK